jgi:hypothetical protein
VALTQLQRIEGKLDQLLAAAKRIEAEQAAAKLRDSDMAKGIVMNTDLIGMLGAEVENLDEFIRKQFEPAPRQPASMEFTVGEEEQEG